MIVQITNVLEWALLIKDEIGCYKLPPEIYSSIKQLYLRLGLPVLDGPSCIL